MCLDMDSSSDRGVVPAYMKAVIFIYFVCVCFLVTVCLCEA